jgi:hypothetical protein
MTDSEWQWITIAYSDWQLLTVTDSDW